MFADSVIAISLTAEEQHFLVWGLQVWQGACNPSVAMRKALGFENEQDIFPWTSEKVRAIADSTELTPDDWTRLVLLAEVGFASSTMGAGLAWTAISGIPGGESLLLLRSVQNKLRSVTRASNAL